MPRDFVFPQDHGSHPGFRTEWWYFTGNLATAQGRQFGFELTFFRYALAAAQRADESTSRWRTNQVWMAHLAVTDVAARRFVAVERLARESLGVAGASAEPLQVWVEDWSASGDGRGEGLSLAVSAADEAAGIGLALELASRSMPVAQGDRGLDRKGPSVGNASYYYSMPRLEARGQLRAGGQDFDVEGLVWLDREWSTSALEGDVVGWDWFALRLSDGSSLMFYRLRTAAGEISAFSSGSYVDPNGTQTRLGLGDLEASALREWQSPTTGVRYPVAWRLRVPGRGLTLEIEPFLDQQELDLSVRYWEGAVVGGGSHEGRKVSVEGYLELAGY